MRKGDRSLADDPGGVVPMIAYRNGAEAMDWLAAADRVTTATSQT